MKVISIVGARPQFIKLGPFSREIRKYQKEIIVHTGQHFDTEMSDLLFRDLEIPQPDFNLNIHGGSHGGQTGKMLIAIEEILLESKPELVVVFGDTNTTLAGLLASSKLGIPSVHIEAGLRSFNKSMPEEINRIVSDHTSDYLFAPNQTAIDNLRNEGLEKKAFLSGDIMVDSLNWGLAKASNSKIIDDYSLTSNNYFLLTLHRPYTVDNPDLLLKLIRDLGDTTEKIIFPVHPRTREIIRSNNIKIPSNFLLIKPVGYLDFIILQKHARKIITDSGGIQKEAYLLKKPCITLRPETEWIETVNSGWNMLLNPATENKLAEKILSFTPPSHHDHIFGDDVAVKMVNLINKMQ